MGIDLEMIGNGAEAIQAHLTSSELILLELDGYAVADSAEVTVLWTAKEALSKVLRCGLTCPLAILEVQSLCKENTYYRGDYVNFSQYQFISWVGSSSVLTLTLPKRTQLSSDLSPILAALL